MKLNFHRYFEVIVAVVAVIDCNIGRNNLGSLLKVHQFKLNTID